MVQEDGSVLVEPVPLSGSVSTEPGAALIPLRADRHRPLFLKLTILVIDLVGITLALWLAFHLGPARGFSRPVGAAERHFVVAALSLPAWAIIFFRYRLYSANHIASRRDEFVRLVKAVAAAAVVMASISFITGFDVSRSWLPLTFVTATVLLAGLREMVRRVLTSRRRNGRLLRRVVIVGGNQDALALSASFKAQPGLGFDVVGFVDDHGSSDLLGAPVLGTLEEARQVILASGARGAIIVSSAVDTEASNRMLRELTDAGIFVELLPSLVGVAAGRLSVRTLGRYPMVHVTPSGCRGWRAVAKGSFDVGIASGGLLIAAPLMALVALAVKLDSRGPVLFRQKRVGRHGQSFDMLKFRSMVLNADEQLAALRDLNEVDGPLFKIRRDPRVTRVGRLLRRFSLDELPQLWNVIRGEMAMVGPRPALPNEVTGWSPQLRERLKVKPGITGLWQISGRSGASFTDYNNFDLYYVDNWSLLSDLSILLRTIPYVISAKGAY